VYLYGDYCSGTIRGIAQNGDGTWSSSPLLSTSLRISTFGEDANGEPYVADVVAGRVYRVTDRVTSWHRAAAH